MDNSDLYKSKSSRHYHTVNRRSLEQHENRKNRKLNRLDKFQQNRDIELSPQNSPSAATPAKTSPTPTDTTTTVASAQKSVRRLSTRSPAVKAVISKKQAFHQRFHKYLEQKKQQRDSNKNRVRPFVSAVASGRFTDTSETQNVATTDAKAKPAKLIEKGPKYNFNLPKPVEVKTIAKPSPINTRSRRLALVSALGSEKTIKRTVVTQPKPKPKRQTATEKALANLSIQQQQKSKRLPVTSSIGNGSKIVAAQKTVSTSRNITAEPSGSGLSSVTKSATKENKSSRPVASSSAVKKNMPTKPPTASSVAKDKKPIKHIAHPPITRNTKPTTSTAKIPPRNKVPSAAAKKVPNKSQNVSKIFQPSDVITSTAVKMKRSSHNTNELFEDTISPINTTMDIIQSGSKPTRRKSIIAVATTSDGFKSPQPLSQPNDELVSTPKAEADQRANLPSINYVSPFVTISRGRHTKRNESAARLSMCAADIESSSVPVEPTVDKQNVEAVKYFRNRLQHEIDHFQNLIEKWQAYAALPENQEILASEYQDLIDVAIGQTKLLTSSKFMQFKKLIDEFEQMGSNMSSEDLEGFWTMVYLQVDNCNQRFERLETLKKDNWIDATMNVSKEKKIRTEGITIAKNKPVKKNANRALQAMIQKARQQYKAKHTNADDVSDVVCLKKHRSTLAQVQANDSMSRRSINGTPKRKSIWVVSIPLWSLSFCFYSFFIELFHLSS